MNARERNEQIVTLYRSGLTLQQIADMQKPQLSRSYIGKIVRLYIPGGFRPYRGPSLRTVDRVNAAFRLRAQGKKWRQIADALGWANAARAHKACYYHPELVP